MAASRVSREFLKLSVRRASSGPNQRTSSISENWGLSGASARASTRKLWTVLNTSLPCHWKAYSMGGRARTIRKLADGRPVSSAISRTAAVSGVSPFSRLPLGNAQRPLARISKNSGPAGVRRQTTPPADTSRLARPFGLASGIRLLSDRGLRSGRPLRLHARRVGGDGRQAGGGHQGGHEQKRRRHDQQRQAQAAQPVR